MLLKRKSPHQLRVEKFMRLAGQGAPDIPVLPSAEIRRLRAALIIEEALETCQALGFSVRSKSGEVVSPKDWQLTDDFASDLVEIADGCADISVVATGCLSACGISDETLLEEVDANNFRKFGPGSSKDANGKHVKPP